MLRTYFICLLVLAATAAASSQENEQLKSSGGSKRAFRGLLRKWFAGEASYEAAAEISAFGYGMENLLLPHARASSRQGYDATDPVVMAPFRGSNSWRFPESAGDPEELSVDSPSYSSIVTDYSGTIGIWSVNLRERSLSAETVSGFGVQTVRSPEYITETDARGLTAAARLILRGTPHTHIRAEPDTTEHGSKEHYRIVTHLTKRVVQETGPKATYRNGGTTGTEMKCFSLSTREEVKMSIPHTLAPVHVGSVGLKPTKKFPLKV
ncbi:hypothetical protein EVAR_59170_1 [Eumeta japonica]|uniref:Uncharacterized protein n=1 Tax=Eumeta variegata TaxID=151549 RepID=A0A4C1YT79_EUMVA|nr:hypothetical protein EVAR_59170_1 [Eumeta japonica]